MKYAIAVLDIGMTNKKILVYDDEFKELESVQRGFAPLTVKGFPVHDLDGIAAWFLSSLKEMGKKYPVK
jgi:sugar (pentulose or hexulose) kinase